MKQNIYDDPAFFAGYSALRSQGDRLNDVLEEPALRAMLPPLAGRRVLDLGCGCGGFCSWAAAEGARAVVGVDLSEKMLAEARRRCTDPRVEFIHAAVEDFDGGPGGCDLVISSLCLHYVRDLAPLLGMVERSLVPGGRFVFSVEHPMCTALLTGWCLDAQGRKSHWPVDRYRDEGLRESEWFVPGVLKYHRTVETYVNGLLDAGFLIGRLGEPEAVADALERRPDLAHERRRPPFLLLQADKPDIF